MQHTRQTPPIHPHDPLPPTVSTVPQSSIIQIEDIRRLPLLEHPLLPQDLSKYPQLPTFTHNHSDTQINGVSVINAPTKCNGDLVQRNDLEEEQQDQEEKDESAEDIVKSLEFLVSVKAKKRVVGSRNNHRERENQVWIDDLREFMDENLMVDNFPPHEFFLHAKYNTPDQVEMTLKKSENEHFLKRFVPREYWAEEPEEPSDMNYDDELENIAYDNRRDQGTEHIFRGEEGIEEEEYVGQQGYYEGEDDDLEGFDDNEEDRKTQKVHLSWLTGARPEQKEETPRNTKKKQKNSSAKRRNKQRSRNEHQNAPWLIKEKEKYPFSGGLSNLMRAPEPNDTVFVSEEEDVDFMKIKEEEQDQNQKEESVDNKIEKDIQFLNTPKKSTAKIAYISTRQNIPEHSPKTPTLDHMKIFLEDNNTPSANLLDFSNQKSPGKPLSKQQKNFQDIHLEISEESDQNFSSKKIPILKDLPEEDNSTKTFQDFNQNQLASPANSSSPTDPSCDSLSEFTTKLKQGTFVVMSEFKENWMQRFGVKGGVMSKEDREEGLRILEEGVERLEELCEKIDWNKMSSQ